MPRSRGGKNCRTPNHGYHGIFKSIQGEGTRAGLPCIFVRRRACNLRCTWCDTAYAFPWREEDEREKFCHAWMNWRDAAKKCRARKLLFR